jgi:t-SNARE complex subunit (syntaxin)
MTVGYAKAFMSRRADLKRSDKEASEIIAVLKAHKKVKDTTVKHQINKVLTLYEQFTDRMQEIESNAGRISDYLIQCSQSLDSRRSLNDLTDADNGRSRGATDQDQRYMQILGNQQVFDQEQIINERGERIHMMENQALGLRNLGLDINQNIYHTGDNVNLINKLGSDIQENVVETNKELETANKLSQSSHKKIWCIVCIIILVIIAIVLVIVFSYIL